MKIAKLLTVVLILPFILTRGGIAETPAAGREAIRAKIKGSVDRGLRYLKSLQVNHRWQIQGKDDPGVTALAVTAFLTSPRHYSAQDGPFIREGLDYLASLAKKDGGIYDRGLANYVTSISVMALKASNDPKYAPLIERAGEFLKRLQCDESEGYHEGDKFYGGAGYGGDERPDLSNMNFWVEGLRATGVPSDDEAYKKAVVFLTRCQNYSETNTSRWTDPHTGKVYVSGNDGGSAYYPGDSEAGFETTKDGTLIPRSYGSMTYALLKCYLFAGVPRDDARMKAAMGWIRDHFTVDSNPGFDTSTDPEAGLQGLYYYFYSVARALDTFGEEVIVDTDGVEHHWRDELAEKVISLQREDGSWVNRKERWWEGIPSLATSYAVLTLNLCYESK